MTTIATVKTTAKASAAAAMILVDRAITSAKSQVQGLEKFEKNLDDAANACILHASTYGDCTLMDKLIKGLPIHPSMTAVRNELISKVRAVSPIAWRADGSVHILKEGETGYKPFDTDKAEETAFFERPAAVKARSDAQKAHTSALKELSLKDLKSRIFGIRRTITAALEADKNGQVRGVVKGEKTKMLKAASAIEEAFLEVTGMEEDEKKAA